MTRPSINRTDEEDGGNVNKWQTHKMSIVFVPKKLRGKAKINQETIQRLLDENDQLIRCVAEYMQKGRAVECVQYQQILHRNIVYLATLADASPDNMPSTSNTASNEASTSTQSVNKQGGTS